MTTNSLGTAYGVEIVPAMMPFHDPNVKYPPCKLEHMVSDVFKLNIRGLAEFFIQGMALLETMERNAEKKQKKKDKKKRQKMRGATKMQGATEAVTSGPSQQPN